jgi:serine O-acetyltransferase
MSSEPRTTLAQAGREMVSRLREDFEVNPSPAPRVTLIVWRAGNALAGRRGPVALVLRLLQQVAVALWLRGVMGAEVPTSIPIGPRLRLPHSTRGMVMHHSVRIGAGCTIFHNTTIGLVGDTGDAPVLQDDVYIGAGAQLLGPITVASGTKIGANAVLLTDTQPDTAYVGVPASPVRRKVS